MATKTSPETAWKNIASSLNSRLPGLLLGLIPVSVVLVALATYLLGSSTNAAFRSYCMGVILTACLLAGYASSAVARGCANPKAVRIGPENPYDIGAAFLGALLGLVLCLVFSGFSWALAEVFGFIALVLFVAAAHLMKWWAHVPAILHKAKSLSKDLKALWHSWHSKPLEHPKSPEHSKLPEDPTSDE